LQDRFSRTGRLTNDHYVAHNCAAGDWRGFHARAATALKQRYHMLIESSLNSFCSHGPVGRSHMAPQHARSDGPQPVATALGDTKAIENSSAPENR
jgi:hypothetical protein